MSTVACAALTSNVDKSVTVSVLFTDFTVVKQSVT